MLWTIAKWRRSAKDWSHVRCGSVEGGEFYEIVGGNAFDGMSGFAPGAQASSDHKHFESELLQLMRHTGAGGFARSSAVEINLLLLGEVLDFFDQVVGLDAN